MLIPLCNNTGNNDNNTNVVVAEVPVKFVVVCIQYGCGGVLLSDGNKYCTTCPDCGAGWYQFELCYSDEIERKQVADLLHSNWHPPLEFRAGNL